MALTEFGLISRFFAGKLNYRSSTHLGIGDDCALLKVPDGYQLAVTTDTMVENVHFLRGTDPRQLGFKLLAVNLSDLAAMGAEPVAVSLALTMPEVDENWLSEFSTGFQALAEQFKVDLIGGDTTTGPLTLTVQAMGLIPAGEALLRSGARPGDLIFMTGSLGDAGLGLKMAQHQSQIDCEKALQRFNCPLPRVKEGIALRTVASSCIDISDGLSADLGHILELSSVGARLDFDQIPLSAGVHQYLNETGDWSFPLCAGDDYELCFTVAPEKAGLLNFACTQIGIIESEPGIRISRHGLIDTLKVKGFEHFSK
ncbi:MAG: thiamine-phosphate kinase [Methylicorpusculum sp.]|uniref:thiamine-phosphate kinase n=1 Tax=Methylicorpusculum sp. TaxID=2713644 RepID=UPI002716BFED|nr:thiamine-phosphate kinase [Methylicorpusculum sp.]MDO8939289.1 thiamine-phosphate kinase [Methylicorpusculum sp.]MDO9242107.1 thiamine-phosphate kinase [Methylicorpusculum sp.]MDP2203817.1 thiamine-phosphate kinase [Methylicorpusculum sp.]